MHIFCRCSFLAPRRRKDILCIKYERSKNTDDIVVPRRNLRSNIMVHLIVQRPNGALYRHSRLYPGYLEWSELDPEVQHSNRRSYLLMR